VTYVLAEQRDRDVVAAFAVYREYLDFRSLPSHLHHPSGTLISQTVDVRTIVGSRRSVWKSRLLVKDVS
jgi:hypothetical protein